MRYKLLLWIICPILLFGQNREKTNTCNCNVLLFQKQQKVPLLDSKGKVIRYIMNDTITEDYFNINILKLSHNLAFVNASGTLHDTIPQKGWIKTKYLGIYPSNFSTINLYFKPNKVSKIKAKIIKPEYYPFNILDCNGKWLYIKYFDGDKKFKEGWLSPEDQCSNPYSTCN